jgi:hypothetical protein
MPNGTITGDLTIDQMKQIAYDAMMKSKDAVCIEITVWAHRCEDEPNSNVRIWYHCNRSDKKFRNLKELANHVYKARRHHGPPTKHKRSSAHGKRFGSFEEALPEKE